MACLSYYPSDITFEGKVWQRAELHLKKVKIINELYKDYHRLEPWRSGRCNFDKYLEPEFKEYINHNRRNRKNSSIILKHSHFKNRNKQSISPFRLQAIKNSTLEINRMHLLDSINDYTTSGKFDNNMHTFLADNSIPNDTESNINTNDQLDMTQYRISSNRCSTSNDKYLKLNRNYFKKNKKYLNSSAAYSFKSPFNNANYSRSSSRNNSGHDQIQPVLNVNQDLNFGCQF